MTNKQRDKSGEVRQFKGSTVFEWDHEPSTMRATGFDTSTVPSALWEASRFGPSTLRVRQEEVRARRRGFAKIAFALLVAVAATTAILLGVARYLHARPATTTVTTRRVTPA